MILITYSSLAGNGTRTKAHNLDRKFTQVNLEWPPVRTQLRTVFILVSVIRNWVRLALLHPVIGCYIRANVS